jgi:photosystem II stability/assembly factor-like uncharacterized protein
MSRGRMERRNPAERREVSNVSFYDLSIRRIPPMKTYPAITMVILLVFLASCSPFPESSGEQTTSTPTHELWTSIGPWGASVNAIAIDPTNPANLYAGAWSGGIFKSTNGGEKWTAINSDMPIRDILSIAVDPEKPTTIYAGTPYGVYKSVNGGGNWVEFSNGLAGHYVTVLKIDPTKPSTIYAAGMQNYGIYKSTNGGRSWKAINDGLIDLNVTSLAIDQIGRAHV